jgi:CDP-diacylglycerol--glycerol-3-phosphate 3-phosphatidyltransferase
MNVPNRLTLSRIGMTGVFVVAMLWPEDGLAGVDLPYAKTIALSLFIVASLTDWLDGWWARRYSLQTPFGALMDPLADKILTAAALITFIQQTNFKGHPLVQSWMVLVIVAREFLVTGMRLVAGEQGLVLRAERLGKHKTGWQMAAIIVILFGLAAREDWRCLGLGFDFFDLWFSRLAFWLMLVAVALTVWSGVAYVLKNRGLLDEA